jgi:hypothetical protein
MSTSIGASQPEPLVDDRLDAGEVARAPPITIRE